MFGGLRASMGVRPSPAFKGRSTGLRTPLILVAWTLGEFVNEDELARQEDHVVEFIPTGQVGYWSRSTALRSRPEQANPNGSRFSTLAASAL
jgi:hypothetical protein